jgi:hypothetical protein
MTEYQEYRHCDWGRHRVLDDGNTMASLHGITACKDCQLDHDSTCGCERCRRIGLCPVHGYDLAACTAQYIVWGVGFGENPGGLEAVDLVDNEDRTVIAAHDPDFDEGDFDETAYYPRWAMIVEADRDILQALQAAGAIRGFAPRF